MSDNLRRYRAIREALTHSESTPCSHNTKVQAALRVFPILTFTLCSTWFVMTRNRNVCCS